MTNVNPMTSHLAMQQHGSASLSSNNANSALNHQLAGWNPFEIHGNPTALSSGHQHHRSGDDDSEFGHEFDRIRKGSQSSKRNIERNKKARENRMRIEFICSLLDMILLINQLIYGLIRSCFSLEDYLLCFHVLCFLV
jgi:hypothetical protein